MQNIFPLITQGEMGGGVRDAGMHRIEGEGPRWNIVLPKQLYHMKPA